MKMVLWPLDFTTLGGAAPLQKVQVQVGCHTISVGKKFPMFWRHYNTSKGHAIVQLAEAPCYKLEGRGFNS